jgi:hypothetical protein
LPNDLYTRAHDVAAALDAQRPDVAQRIRDVISGGSTSTEILFGLRTELEALQASPPQTLGPGVNALRLEIDQLLCEP